VTPTERRTRPTDTEMLDWVESMHRIGGCPDHPRWSVQGDKGQSLRDAIQSAMEWAVAVGFKPEAH
jgi:hypothetical protein